MKGRLEFQLTSTSRKMKSLPTINHAIYLGGKKAAKLWIQLDNDDHNNDTYNGLSSQSYQIGTIIVPILREETGANRLSISYQMTRDSHYRTVL